MKFSIRLMILGLGLINGLTVGSADVLVDGQVIQEADISAISIDPISGDVIVSAGGLYTVTRDGDPPPGPQVIINTLTRSASPILENESVTISWTTTEADSCNTSGGGGGWAGENIPAQDLASGQRTVTLALAGTYTFTLDCSNDTPTSTSRSVTVLVNEDVTPPPGPDCGTPTLSGSTVSWEGLLGFDWPDPGYSEKVIGIPTAGYLAIEFNTGDIVNEDGGVKSIPHISTQGSRLGAISECPGDFMDFLPDAEVLCKRTWFDGGTLNWSTDAFPAAWECELQPNTTYYLNLTFTDGVSADTDQCSASSGSCRTILRVFN
jgi:hypothetical protein